MKLLPLRRVGLHMTMIFILIISSSFQPASKRYTLRKVVIDAGHGGHDTGCLGMSAKEKDIALSLALKLGKLIEENFADVKVIYTRKTDVFIELHQRAEIANNAKADLFICIHCNSACHYDKKARKVKCNEESDGAETWVMGLHKSEANLEVAKRENEVVLMEKDYQKKYDGFDPNSPEANIIFSLYQDTYVDQSLKLASFVQDEMKKAGRDSRGIKQAGFLVLYRTYMPGILIETGFLSNKAEEKFLSSAYGQEIMANSIFNAFKAYKNSVEYGEPEKASDTSNQSMKIQPKIDPLPVKDSAAKTKIDTASLYNPKSEKPKVADTVKVNPDTATIKQQTNRSQYYFSVQLILSPTQLPANSERFKGIENTNEELDNGFYKYTVGHFSRFDEAVVIQNKMRQHGFKDCFIVGYKEGKRIPASEARKELKQ
jgi:N-acetylmuramoyl-L-alanine amidase